MHHFKIPQQCPRLFVSLHFHQHLLYVLFFFIAVLRGISCISLWVLIYISLMTNHAEYLCICSSAIHISSLEKCQFKLFVHFVNWVIFSLFNSKIALYILYIFQSPLSDI